MTYVCLALLGEVDESLMKRLDDSPALMDHLVDKAVGVDFLLACTREQADFQGVKAIRLGVDERPSEELIALIAERDVDFGWAAFRAYADPFNSPSLYEDNRVWDGFTLMAGKPYDIPEDGLRLLRAMNTGARLDAVYRRGGEPAAVMDARIFLGRCGPGYPSTEELLRPFSGQSDDSIRLSVISFSVKGGKITVDNTFSRTEAWLPSVQVGLPDKMK